MALSRYGEIFAHFNRMFAILALLFAAETAVAQGANAAPPLIVALGDSLTAGYGLPPEQAFPAVLERKLAAAGKAVRIQNAGVSGDTTAGGRARVGWALADKPQFVILELGANDALRGIDPRQTETNLDAILGELKGRGVKVLLTGMRAPPNLGREYAEAFDGIFPRLAAKHGVPLYPFFLDGVAAERELNQADGIHPNGRGVEIIAERIAPYVLRLISGG